MNSSTNSEIGLLSPSSSQSQSQSQSLAKVKQSSNKENKLQRFVNGGTFVFGKIKSLWSHNSTGLNTMLSDFDRRKLASDEKRKSQDNLGLFHYLILRVFMFA